jgi:aminomethyltransferase
VFSNKFKSVSIMKNTVFTDFHIKLGARMQPFAGFNMPVEYSGINDEHITVREKAGVFDVSHMGEFRVKGPGAAGFLQYITTNDITRLTDGMVQYSCFPNGRGGIIDDLLVYRFSQENFMLVVNAANIEKDWNWCAGHAREHGLEVGTDLYNASDEISLLAVQGPYALRVMQKLTDEPVENMKYHTFREISIAGIKNAVFSTTGYTGSGGCEVYIANEDGPALWNAVFEAGREFGIKPAGLGARDTLRLEMGFCLYGNDIDETTSPIEAGLGWITKFSDNNEFIDKELLLQQKKESTHRKLVGFILRERGIPRLHYEIADDDHNIIGNVTSGTMSPMMKTGIGMGYVKSDFAREGTEINILIRNKSIRAEVVRPPLFKETKK